ncbi:MAG: hypothetical protein WAW06_00440 [bacterium]
MRREELLTSFVAALRRQVASRRVLAAAWAFPEREKYPTEDGYLYPGTAILIRRV